MREGMKVVCVCSNWSDWIPDSPVLAAFMETPGFPGDPVVGRVYTIAHISFDDASKMCLNLEEIPDRQTPGGRHSFRYYASGFKPLEDVHNEMFREMVTPANLIKARAFILAIDAVQAAGRRALPGTKR